MHHPARESYDPGFYSLLFQVEARHFWFRARNEVIAWAVDQLVADLHDGYRMVEVGCGTGYVLGALQRVCAKGAVVGMDLLPDGLHLARLRSRAPLVQGDVHAPPFGARFDLVGLFDVLEHLADDQRVLASLRALLSRGGKLVLTVPAHPNLWSYFDEASHHVRRYERTDLVRKIERSGFEIEKVTYFMASLWPLVRARRMLAASASRGRSASPGKMADLAAHELRVVPVVNDILVAVLSIESRLLARRGRLMCGTSLLAIARAV